MTFLYSWISWAAVVALVIVAIMNQVARKRRYRDPGFFTVVVIEILVVWAIACVVVSFVTSDLTVILILYCAPMLYTVAIVGAGEWLKDRKKGQKAFKATLSK